MIRLFLAVMLLLVAGCGPRDPLEEARIAQARVAGEAKVICERFTAERLKAPSTAKFQSQAEYLVIAGSDASRINSIAKALVQAYASPLLAKEALDGQLNVLTAGDGLTVDSLERQGNYADARAIITAALIKKFQSSGFLVTGHVDAQNGYGAMIRGQFLCLQSPSGGQWHLDGFLLLS